jgi:3-methyladenine DNA glycosylase AlkD
MDIQKTLLSMGEPEYRDFQSKLMPTVDKGKIIGIPTPILRKFAKSLENYDNFLTSLPHRYYEEDNLHAFIIERETNFEKCIEKLNVFLPYIDSWATCDSLKPMVLKKYPEKLFYHIKLWIASNHI